MAFATHAIEAALLVWFTLSLQSAGMAALILWVRDCLVRGMYRLGVVRSSGLMVRFTSAIFVLHLLQILLWAGFYRWSCFPSWEAAFYFSAASYSTVGYGDLVLPRIWRTLGPLESVTGVLMCGLSAALLFAVVIRLVEREGRLSPDQEHVAAERR
jgi:hypothetical protein